MKLQSRSKKFVVRATFVCALSLAVSACMTGDSEFSEDTESTDAGLVAGVLSVVGLESQRNADIQYKERAPLVMPTQANALPQPDSRELSEVASNWPVDRSKEELEEIRAFYKVEPGQPLSIEQLRGHPSVQKASARPRDFEAEKRQRQLLDGDKLTPAELAAMGKKYQEARKQLGGKDMETQICAPGDEACVPTRKYLTEPPVAYSTPVAGVAFATPDVDESELVRQKREAAAIEDGARIDMGDQ
ncbi:hypothetical protein PsAD2_02226 [Pseudovibrio axinellae]|uniref:Lipoprotein n=1 Tax=Pseudovibrio axinellae TaxID=989403 RepID=A0A165YCC5_9HYPH|nr:hypothetical protein [Pseudovibrio axinellae]KZL18711.1 hypothetical protein PsAD2_02226 [Pseudovibrio axinellae]SEP95783.1 hypothetical protein SAMN05421798_101815 [Pseudovibrio axinellae]